jgi:hypothetical protein
MKPLNHPDPPAMTAKLSFYNTLIQSSPDSSFHEMTGKTGDVILLHPLMLHTASKNGKRAVRIITNPPVHLREPFVFNREDGKESLVERKTVQDVSSPLIFLLLCSLCAWALYARDITLHGKSHGLPVLLLHAQ